MNDPDPGFTLLVLQDVPPLVVTVMVDPSALTQFVLVEQASSDPVLALDDQLDPPFDVRTVPPFPLA